MTSKEIRERITKLVERKIPTVDVQYENAAALWQVALELRIMGECLGAIQKQDCATAQVGA
jgi:hypothetical protein